MAKIYQGNVVEISLDCKEDVDSQSDLWIYYKKPESEIEGLWKADGVGNLAQYTTVKDVDLDEVGTWIIQPFSDTYDVHGDIVKLQVFEPIVPARKDSAPAYLVGA